MSLLYDLLPLPSRQSGDVSCQPRGVYSSPAGSGRGATVILASWVVLSTRTVTCTTPMVSLNLSLFVEGRSGPKT